MEGAIIRKDEALAETLVEGLCGLREGSAASRNAMPMLEMEGPDGPSLVVARPPVSRPDGFRRA